MAICSNCSNEGTGDYCSACGHAYVVKRITIVSILHEVAHIFAHFEKGFGYTFKQLATRPGRMQKDYFAGARKKHHIPLAGYYKKFNTIVNMHDSIQCYGEPGYTLAAMMKD